MTRAQALEIFAEYYCKQHNINMNKIKSVMFIVENKIIETHNAFQARFRNISAPCLVLRTKKEAAARRDVHPY